MATLLRMPEVAAGATEAVLNDWLVAEDGTVAAGQPLVVIETEKATVEIEAESAAQVLKLLVTPGATVPVGAPIAVLVDPGEQVDDLGALLSSLGVGASDPTGATAEPSAPEVPAPGSNGAKSRRATNGAGTRVFASPLARRLLTEAGLSVTDAVGTGPNGRITRCDVQRALAERAATATPAPVVPETAVPQTAAPAAPVEPSPPAARAAAASERAAVRPAAGAGGVSRIPHTPIRRAIARRLTESKQTVPHFYLKASCGVDALLELRRELNAVSEQRISVNDLLVKAVGRAHTLVPEMNVAWSDDELLRFDQVDVGVAVAAERGLVTPVVRAVDTRSVTAVAADVRRLSGQANDGRLRQADLEGGSITVTNLGMFGVQEFSAIINPPQAAILAVGATRSAPVVSDGQLTSRTELTVVLSVDHRSVDGALAARWMQTFTGYLEQPLGLLL